MLSRRTPLVMALLSLVISQMHSTARAADLPPAEKFHLYLLIGQSNMAGRGVLGKEPQTPPERVLKFDQNNKWVPATEPFHFDKPKIAGAGLGLSFAESMAKANPGVTIGVIPCAVGGTPLSRWQKDGDLYKDAVERAKLAMKDGTLKGILWHQGEGDSGSEALANSYATRLGQMVRDLRTELNSPDVPFVAGELGQFLAKRDQGKPSFWRVVNEQINLVPTQIPHAAAVSSAGLEDKGDLLHFGTEGLREFGLRYAAAMQKLQKP